MGRTSGLQHKNRRQVHQSRGVFRPEDQKSPASDTARDEIEPTNRNRISLVQNQYMYRGVKKPPDASLIIPTFSVSVYELHVVFTFLTSF